jgi:hypothetical protein
MKPLDIERLLQWAFIDELPKGGANPYSRWNFFARLLELGGFVDDQFGPPTRLPPIFGEPHPDALEIARVVRRLSYPASELIAIHASARNRPEWMPQPIQVLPITKGTRYAVVGENRGKHRGRVYYSEGAYCPLQWVPTLEQIADARAEYSAWHTGLRILVVTLQLRDHEATGPAASAAPWLKPEPQSRVLVSQGRRTCLI